MGRWSTRNVSKRHILGKVHRIFKGEMLKNEEIIDKLSSLETKVTAIHEDFKEFKDDFKESCKTNDLRVREVETKAGRANGKANMVDFKLYLIGAGVLILAAVLANHAGWFWPSI